jgi:hypothetical protein
MLENPENDGRLVIDAPDYDVFISYAGVDNAGGWVSALRDAIYEDFRSFTSEPFKIFFDTKEIHRLQAWERRLREGLRSSRRAHWSAFTRYVEIL